MPSADGPEGPRDHRPDDAPLGPSESLDRQLFESLVHHLVEKGVLTKNDALSVVQSVAEVKRGELESERYHPDSLKKELTVLERLYSSFELMRELAASKQGLGGDNVLRLRPPLHGDNPKFPKDD